MTTIDRAAEIIAEAGAYCGQCCFGECGEPDCPRDADWRACPDCAAAVTGYARALADAGLLAPAPQIILTREALCALDPDAAVMNFHPVFGYGICTAEDWTATIEEFPDIEWFPFIVIASGPHIRAAHNTLKEFL